jgi:hypothetical protein
MENLSYDQIKTINAALQAYPSNNFFQALSSMSERIYSITRSLGTQAKLGMTSIGMATKQSYKLCLKSTFRTL